MKILFVLLAAPLLAQNSPTTCAQNLKTKSKFNLRMAEKACEKAKALAISSEDFENCIIYIHSKTEVAAEIISPYCFRRRDEKYLECVIEKHRNNVRENPFKLCLKKFHPKSHN